MVVYRPRTLERPRSCSPRRPDTGAGRPERRLQDDQSGPRHHPARLLVPTRGRTQQGPISKSRRMAPTPAAHSPAYGQHGEQTGAGHPLSRPPAGHAERRQDADLVGGSQRPRCSPERGHMGEMGRRNGGSLRRSGLPKGRPQERDPAAGTRRRSRTPPLDHRRADHQRRGEYGETHRMRGQAVNLYARPT